MIMSRQWLGEITDTFFRVDPDCQERADSLEVSATVKVNRGMPKEPFNKTPVPLRGMMAERLFEEEVCLGPTVPVPVARPVLSVRAAVELVIRLEKGTGTVGQVLATIAGHRAQVLTSCHYRDWHGTTLMLVTDNDDVARLALEAAGIKYTTEPVVLVEAARQLGTAAELAAHLHAAGVTIVYSYVSPLDGDKLHVVFKTLDNDRALAVLRHSFSASAHDGCSHDPPRVRTGSDHGKSDHKSPVG
jgi:hypothetical protein